MSQQLETSFNESWLTYKTPAVRQLAFALLSPNIIQDIPTELEILHSFQLHDHQFWNQHYQQYIPRLQYLDQHPDELHHFLNQLKSTRLGLRFEMFIWFWLLDQQYHPYHLLNHSLQIINGPKTIGELDFLIQNTETNQIEHWEVALKYYLGEHDLSLQYWYGLNRSDTLFKKMNHFSQKQFQFSHVSDFNIDQKFAVIKGQLYLPQHLPSSKIPRWINPTRRLGTWGPQFPSNYQNFHRLSRHEWLCPDYAISNFYNTWWTDGLYFNPSKQIYYMLRSSLLTPNLI